MNFNELLKIGQERRTCKNYNPNLIVDQDKIDSIYKFALTAPHTMGLELHNIVSISKNGEHFNNVAELMSDFNIARAKGASHIAILTTLKEFAINDKDGVFKDRCIAVTKNIMRVQGKEYKPGNEAITLDKALNSDFGHNNGNSEEWLSKQAYITLGFMLIAAKTLGVDSTPVEGFSPELDEYLLKNKMITKEQKASVILFLGHTDDTIVHPYIGEKQFRRDIKDFVKQY